MFENLLATIAKALDVAAIPYMVIGGQAVLVYGNPRLTEDIDITLGLSPEDVARVVQLAEAQGWNVLPEDPQSFARETYVLPCVHPDSGVRIDFVFSVTPYESEAIERARTQPMGDTTVRIAAPEDIIIHKLVAGRARDYEDVRSILGKVRSLDNAYIRRWLPEFEPTVHRPLLSEFEAMLSHEH